MKVRAVRMWKALLSPLLGFVGFCAYAQYATDHQIADFALPCFFVAAVEGLLRPNEPDDQVSPYLRPLDFMLGWGMWITGLLLLGYGFFVQHKVGAWTY